MQIFNEYTDGPQLTDKTFACWKCGTPSPSRYDHISIGSRFGPWYCNTCGYSSHGFVEENGIATITRGQEASVNTWNLLQLNVQNTADKVYIIVASSMRVKLIGDSIPADLSQALQEQQGQSRYYYNEHTCPINYLGVPIQVNGDTDCHGIFVHVETVLTPTDFDSKKVTINRYLDELNGGWGSVFKKLSTSD